ncbi:MAG: type 1 glutamine amidotransferase [Gammaproteobacteria bacterium]|nr:type 1 glutamine amidotransferase [Gammaproteobacteria bacterium]
MKPVRIFRHIECEGPGYLAEFLDQRRVPWELVAIDQGESVPPGIDDVSGLVFMGGPMSVNDDLPWIHAEQDLIRMAANARLPVLGHCLGGQMIARALGAVIGSNSVREIGWHDLSRVDSPAADDWLASLPRRFEAFHWHGETFSLPPGAWPLLRSEHCCNQGFVVDNMLGLQCHVEMTADMVREWAALYADELREPSASVQSAEQMLENLDERAAALNHNAKKLYERWLRPIVNPDNNVR